MSRDLNGNEAAVGSYNRATDVQRKRDVADGNRPFDHDSDRSTRSHLACGCHQHALAADVHRPARSLYFLCALDGITRGKREGEANLLAALRFIKGSQALHRLVSYVEHDDEPGVTTGYMLYRSRPGNTDPIRPQHDAGMQRNLHRDFQVNHSAG